jgi:5-enolpyruvylshikimate-3-phosphate synthase
MVWVLAALAKLKCQLQNFLPCKDFFALALAFALMRQKISLALPESVAIV